MSKNLKQYVDKFSEWNNERIEKIYNRLKNGELLNFQIVSLESEDQIVKEMQMVSNTLKTNHFLTESVECINNYLLTFWNNIESNLITTNCNENEFETFKKWFSDLLYKDVDENGLTLDSFQTFTVEWEEFNETDFTFDELWNCLESESLV